MKELGLIDLFAHYKSIYKIEFDLTGFIRLLVYGRILNPASKIATVSQNNDYYTPIINNPYEYNVYDSLDFVYKYRKTIFNTINKAMVTKLNRKSDLVFYDVTNFYFEIEDPDAVVSVAKGDSEKTERWFSPDGIASSPSQKGIFVSKSGKYLRR